MEKRKYDKLDELFQSRLKSENVAPGDWNQAPADLLTNALDSIQTDTKKKRRIIAFWILVGLFIASLLFINFRNYNKISQLESKINVLKESKNNAGTILQDKTAVFLESSIAEAPGIAEDKMLTPNNNESTVETVPENSRNLSTGLVTTNSSFKSQAQKSSSAQAGKDEANIEFAQIMNPIQESEHAAIPKKKNERSVSVLDARTIHPLTHQYLFPNREIIPFIRTVSKLSIRPFVYIGYNKSSIRMTNPENSGFSLTGYENYQGGYFGGIGIDLPLNKRFDLSLNAGYNCIHINSIYEDEIIYDITNEFTNNQGERIYDANYNVESVIGRYSGSLAFDLNNKNMEDQEIMEHATEIKENFKILNLGISTKFKLLAYERFRFGLQAGVNTNYLIGLDDTMETIVMHKEDIMMKKDFKNSSLDQAERLYFSLFGNLGLEYDLTDMLILGLEGGLDHSVSSIRKVQNPEDSKTYLNSNKLALTLSYKF